MDKRTRQTGAQPPYTLLDRWLLLFKACCDSRLSRGDAAVLGVLLNHVDATGRAYPGPARIASHAMIDVRTVKRCIRRLEEHGYLEVERPGLRIRNLYWPVFQTRERLRNGAYRSAFGDMAIPF